MALMLIKGGGTALCKCLKQNTARMKAPTISRFTRIYMEHKECANQKKRSTCQLNCKFPVMHASNSQKSYMLYCCLVSTEIDEANDVEVYLVATYMHNYGQQCAIEVNNIFWITIFIQNINEIACRLGTIC